MVLGCDGPARRLAGLRIRGPEWGFETWHRGKRGSIISQSNFAGRGRAVSHSDIRTYAQAMRQANKEARATVAALACIIVVWLVGGFGLAGTDIWVFHTPLWVIGGCVAPWIAAVVAAVVLSRRVFADFDLDEVAGSCPAGSADASGRARGADIAACNGAAAKRDAAGSNVDDAAKDGE